MSAQAIMAGIEQAHDGDTNLLQAGKTPNKRKRDVSDLEGPGTRPVGAGGRRSSFKQTPSNGSNLEDQATPSFLSAQPSDDELHTSDSLDFSALTHHQSDLTDQANGSHHAANATSTAAAALAGLYPTMTVPQPTDLSFGSTGPGGDPAYSLGDHDTSHIHHALTGSGHRDDASGGGQRPTVGSDEWHKLRRDNHKEVERRRRETINEGINELAKIVPGCEKNKGSILQRAVQFITQLKENESSNIEKWTLEKLLTEQAIAELSGSVDKLKEDCERAWREVEKWKTIAQNAGLAPKDEPVSGGADSNAES